MLGEVAIDGRRRNAVKSQVPRRVPGVLPLIRHRDNIIVDHVVPVPVPGLAALAEQRIAVMLREPGVGFKGVVLLAPEHASQALANDAGLV